MRHELLANCINGILRNEAEVMLTPMDLRKVDGYVAALPMLREPMGGAVKIPSPVFIQMGDGSLLACAVLRYPDPKGASSQIEYTIVLADIPAGRWVLRMAGVLSTPVSGTAPVKAPPTTDGLPPTKVAELLPTSGLVSLPAQPTPTGTKKDEDIPF